MRRGALEPRQAVPCSSGCQVAPGWVCRGISPLEPAALSILWPCCPRLASMEPPTRAELEGIAPPRPFHSFAVRTLLPGTYRRDPVVLVLRRDRAEPYQVVAWIPQQ